MKTEYAYHAGVKYKVHKDLRKTFNGSVSLVSKGLYGGTSVGFTGSNTKGEYKGTFMVHDKEMAKYTKDGLLTVMDRAEESEAIFPAHVEVTEKDLPPIEKWLEDI